MLNNQLITMDALTLASTPLPERMNIVSGLLSNGLNIIGGLPKCGKSWMMLQMSIAVAKGEPFLDMQTTRCSVLNLCLEDTYYRVQKRLFALTDDAPENLHFAVTAACIGENLADQITGFVKEHPDTKLVVIDTLQRVRGTGPDSPSYALDYAEMSVLKQLADSLGLTVLMVHHLKKEKDLDPFLRISGTNGIVGAANTAIVLLRELQTRNGSLFIKGRDIEDQELKIRMGTNCAWEFLGRKNAEEIYLSSVPDFIHNLPDMLEGSFAGSASELIELLEITKDVAPNVITKLLNQHSYFLKEHSITYRYERTRDKRLIHLERDSCDTGDGILPHAE